jgi:hypothetical protein
MAMVIGIDLGLTGAMSLISQHGLEDMRDLPVMPRSAGGTVKNQINAAELHRILKEWIAGHEKNEFMVFWERVNAMPKQGSASTFSLGHTAGVVEGVVCALGLPTTMVTPAQWKKHFKLNSDKDVCRAMAQRLYPEASLGRVKDHNRAESCLIARYGWEQFA